MVLKKSPLRGASSFAVCDFCDSDCNLSVFDSQENVIIIPSMYHRLYAQGSRIKCENYKDQTLQHLFKTSFVKRITSVIRAYRYIHYLRKHGQFYFELASSVYNRTSYKTLVWLKQIVGKRKADSKHNRTMKYRLACTFDTGRILPNPSADPSTRTPLQLGYPRCSLRRDELMRNTS